MRRLSSSRSSGPLFAAALIVGLACAPGIPAARTVDPNADVVVPYPVAGGGTVRFTVRPRYPVGQPITIRIDVIAGSVEIRGPLAGRVLGSGLEGEKVVRTFGPGTIESVDIAPDQTGHATITWDGRADDGAQVPAETYSAAFDFVIGGESTRFGSVIQVVRP